MSGYPTQQAGPPAAGSLAVRSGHGDRRDQLLHILTGGRDVAGIVLRQCDDGPAQLGQLRVLS